jgi:cytochrome oxidase Cu insertion factor (SCO1/SenC/PrrC family)
MAVRSKCIESGSMLKHKWILVVMFVTSFSAFAWQQTAQQFDPNANLKTGPAVGEKIPAFSAIDQTGKIRDFDSLKGPQGLVLFFNRSVDW